MLLAIVKRDVLFQEDMEKGMFITWRILRCDGEGRRKKQEKSA